MHRVGGRRGFGIVRIGLILPSLFVIPWIPLFRLASGNDEYTYIILLPFIAMGLIYADRGRIFAEIRYCRFAIIPMVLTALLLFGQRNAGFLSQADDLKLFLATLLGICVLLADFLFCFGVRAFRGALFPLLLLVLSVPVPKPMMAPVIRFLQEGSAAFSTILFKLIRLPAFRQGLVFSLPGFDIEVAEQCSGIRSSIVLCIASMLGAHLFLRAFWRKLFVVLITVPLVIFKNALRIVTISTLAVYINHGFLHGRLHRYSGIPFSLVDLAIMTPLLLSWHSRETRRLRPTLTATGEDAVGVTKPNTR